MLEFENLNLGLRERAVRSNLLTSCGSKSSFERNIIIQIREKKMDNKRYQGKTLDGAISEACADLGIPSDKLKYKVVQEGSDGLFGLGLIGAKKFIIEITDGKDISRNDKKPAAANNKPVRDKVKADNLKDKSNKTVSENGRKTVKTDNAENSESNGGKADQRQSDRRNNKDRAKDRTRRSDKDQDNKTIGGYNQVRGERRNQDERRKANTGASGNVNGAANAGTGGADNANKVNAEGAEIKTETRQDRAPRRYEKTGEVTGDPVKTGEEFLTSLFKSMEMNISYHGEFKSENNELVINLSGDDMGVLIGKRGQTLDALQYLTSQVVNKHQTAYIRVKIDTENYRERRKETMESLAQNVALKVKKTHKPVALEPMNPYERRIIHAFLQNDKDIITKSEGVEPYRHVIVCPVKKKKTYGQRNKDEAKQEETENAELKLSESTVSVEASDTAEVTVDTGANVNVDSVISTTETEIKVTEAEGSSDAQAAKVSENADEA